jgi:hypothetical protein
MHRSTTTTVVAAALAVLLIATTPATAAGGTGLVTVETEDDGLAAFDRVADVVWGALSGFSPADMVRDVLGDEPDAKAEAAELRDFLTANSTSIIAHTNTVIEEYDASVGNSTYVVETTVSGDTGSGTLYVIAEGNGSAVTDYRVVKETSETVDAERTLSAFEAEDLNADLRAYHDEYVTTGEVPSKDYYAQMAGKHALSG